MRFVPCSLWWGPWVHSLAVFFFFLGPRVVPSLAVWCWQCPKQQGRANVEERAIVSVSAAEKWQLKCGCSCWALLFFLLNMLWSRHVKPSSAKGEKRQKRIKTPKFVQTEAFPESALCTSLRVAVQSWKVELPLQRNTTLRKNLPETITSVFSPSRSARRAPPGNSNWFDHCRHWGGVAIVTRMQSSFFFPLFFLVLLGTTGAATSDVVDSDKGEIRSISLMRTSEHQEREGQIDPAVRRHPFFFLVTSFPLPRRGRGEHKPGTGLELGTVPFYLKPKVTLAPRGIKFKQKDDLHVWAQHDNELDWWDWWCLVSCACCTGQITKRHVRAMCAQSEGVRHFDGERVQARCVVVNHKNCRMPQDSSWHEKQPKEKAIVPVSCVN